MSNKAMLLSTIIYVGVVDQVGDGWVQTELAQDDYSEEFIFPEEMFPCEISEGDYFYISKVGNVTEIRCGKPTK